MRWRARTSPEALVVAAASARPFVRAAAAAGYRVIAADVFCDADTRRAASRVIRLGYAQGGFDAADARRRLYPVLTEGVGFVYGSGFETQPRLLDDIALRCRVFGNDAETVGIVKDPGRFFALLAALDIPHPDTVLDPPPAGAGWLSKRIGGSGGTHVVPVAERGGASRYYQHQVPGQPFSLLFLADGKAVRVVGFNAQWLAPLPDMPYRYGGAVSRAELPDAVRAAMVRAAGRLTAELGLRGLNSLDCMVHGAEWWVLEVNPRLSATFALYDVAAGGARLFEAHLQACSGSLPDPLPPEQARAHLIYYAPFELAIPAAIHWPDWVADVPEGPVLAAAGEPVCTVLAAGANAAAAMALAKARADELSRRIT